MKEKKIYYSIEQINSIAKDMKYEALYWALGYEEVTKSNFIKKYNNLIVKINSNEGIVDFNNQITIVKSDVLKLDTHKSFVVLECIDKLLMMGYLPSEIIVDLNNEYDIYCNNLYIKCYEWNHMEEDNSVFKKDVFKSISYSSRLVSGIIERLYSVKDSKNNLFNSGIFENELKQDNYFLSNTKEIQCNDFIIKNNIAIKYCGVNKNIVFPEGIVGLASGLFWDNQIIENIILPNSLISIGGDTFYNCSNLKKINIPKNVRYMGNNPFAGCPLLEIDNESKNFKLIDGVLYNNDCTRLIYYPINKKDDKYNIIEGTKIIGKHSFYLNSTLEEVTIPKSVIKLENNPFSGCSKLNIINQSNNYVIIDKVIYDRDLTSVIGCLNSINTNELVLKDVTRICRNSFWNCKGIRKIVLPSTLKTIGYNPFVGCSNIEFISKSDDFIVSNGALYNKDKSKLICYPAKYAIGDIYLPDETITLERGAFSGANKLNNIHLHNVSIISKTCFTNCDSLENVYCSDLVSYIGEWAFAHCKNLKEISVYKDCYIDKNVLLNTSASLQIRDTRSNYVIESDNMHTLTSMLNSYQNKIDSIVIDPPYNSKIDYIGYQDSNFKNGYISFLKNRLDIAYKLLSDNGYLFINIDKGECRNIARLCNSIFRKVKICKWEKLHPYFDINRNVDSNKKKVKYEFIIVCSKTIKFNFNKIKQPYIYNGGLLERDAEFPSTFSCFGTNSSAKDELRELFGTRDYFRTPKPLKLIEEFIRASTNKNSIVLDFFAGSGTAGHAVETLNKEDNGRRTYILVSNNESNICRDVTLKRMQLINSKVTFLG